MFNDSLTHYLDKEKTLTTISKILLQLIEENNNATFLELRRNNCILTKKETLMVADRVKNAEYIVVKEFK